MNLNALYFEATNSENRRMTLYKKIVWKKTFGHTNLILNSTRFEPIYVSSHSVHQFNHTSKNRIGPMQWKMHSFFPKLWKLIYLQYKNTINFNRTIHAITFEHHPNYLTKQEGRKNYKSIRNKRKEEKKTRNTKGQSRIKMKILRNIIHFNYAL